MIDVSSFSAYHGAFWADHTPTSEHFVRRINLEYTERWSRPVHKPSQPIRAALVAELAFSRSCARIDDVPEEQIERFAHEETIRRLLPLTEDPNSLYDAISAVEEEQVFELESSLRSFLNARKSVTVTRPVFHGCGYIDSSEGDILSGSCLFEVKAVDRPFRSADVRQLISYCALNHSSRQYSLDTMGLFNPRRGIYFEAPIDDVSREISGQSSQELFDNIVYAISSGDISR